MLIPRFDAARLTPVALSDVSSRACAATDALLRACLLGAGPATRPGLMPWLAPRIEWPFGVLHVRQAEVARRACLALDGSWLLADAASSAARWRIRLAAQRADWSWWRPLAASDAWDAGQASSITALQGFVPRRATLIVVDHSSIDEASLGVLASLEQQAWQWPRTVRLVVAGGEPPDFARPV